MLVLARRLGESLLIGDDVIVTVVAIRGSVIRLGIAAPAETRVDRVEVRDRRDRQEEEAREP